MLSGQYNITTPVDSWMHVLIVEIPAPSEVVGSILQTADVARAQLGGKFQHCRKLKGHIWTYESILKRNQSRESSGCKVGSTGFSNGCRYLYLHSHHPQTLNLWLPELPEGAQVLIAWSVSIFQNSIICTIPIWAICPYHVHIIILFNSKFHSLRGYGCSKAKLHYQTWDRPRSQLVHLPATQHRHHRWR